MADSIGKSDAASHALVVAARLVIFTLVCAILYWGKAIFVPVALAILFSFILSPLVKRLERLRLPRMIAVIAVAAAAATAVSGLLWVLTTQLAAFAEELPAKREIIKEKLADIRGMSRGNSIDAIQETIESVNEEIDQEVEEGETQTPPETAPAPIVKTANEGPIAVTVVPKSKILDWNNIQALTPVFASAGQVALVLVLVIFLLISEEDIRGRIVGIAGDNRLAVTTSALHHAGSRISRYLSTQLLLNGGYGVAVATGLYLLNVPYAFLWGVCAAVFRYIPYVGPWVAALLPLTTTLLSSPGWATVGAVLLLFIVLEIISNNVLEPWLYGKSVGIPAFVLLISAIFWTWLWGPVGLVLSTPLTVCLVALGEHVEPLRFLARMFGSESQLAPHLLLYQRLLARDDDGAATLIAAHTDVENPDPMVTPADAVSRDVIAPVLSLIKRDSVRQSLHEGERERILALLAAEIDVLTESYAVGKGKVDGSRILLCPALDDIDEIAAKVLALVLKAGGASCRVVSHSLLASEVNDLAKAEQSRMICIVSVAPGAVAAGHRLCKRLQRNDNTADIAINHWGVVNASSRRTLQNAGARYITEGLWEGHDLLAPIDQFYASQGEAA